MLENSDRISPGRAGRATLHPVRHRHRAELARPPATSNKFPIHTRYLVDSIATRAPLGSCHGTTQACREVPRSREAALRLAATDRRRTIIQIIPAQATLIGEWLDSAAKPSGPRPGQSLPQRTAGFPQGHGPARTDLRSQDAQSRPAHHSISVRAGDSMDAPPGDRSPPMNSIVGQPCPAANEYVPHALRRCGNCGIRRSLG